MVRHSGFFQSKYQPNQLLGSMGKCDIVMFALSPFFGEISGKGRVPVTTYLVALYTRSEKAPGTARAVPGAFDGSI